MRIAFATITASGKDELPFKVRFRNQDFDTVLIVSYASREMALSGIEFQRRKGNHVTIEDCTK